MNQLKEAEKKASQLVQDARKARVDRMKEAKSEAEKMISDYRLEMEANFSGIQAKHSGVSGAAGTELDASTNKDIRSMTNDFSTRKAGVTTMLCDQVCAVKIQAPKARGQ